LNGLCEFIESICMVMGLHQGSRYDPAGRLLEQQISQTQPCEAVGIRRSYAYDKAGRLVAIGDSRCGNLTRVGRFLEAHSRLKHK